MLGHCFIKDCELEVQYVCSCLSSETYWCEFHLEAHLKLPNRTHSFDSILLDPREWTNDNALEFLEKERYKKEKLKKIILASFRQNLYNSKISIEETLRKLDNEIEEINDVTKEFSQTSKQEQNSLLSSLSLQPDSNAGRAIGMAPENSKPYNSIKSFWAMIQLKAKRSAILSQANNNPDMEEDFRKTCSSYENHAFDPQLNQAYQEYTNDYSQMTSLYLTDGLNLFIYDTESEREEKKELKIPGKFTSDARIAHLPNCELFCNGYRSDNVLIISKNNRIRVAPSGSLCFRSSSTYYNRNVYCFGAEYKDYIWDYSRRFDLDHNRLIDLAPMPWSDRLCYSILFNGNIIISGYENTNLLIYSIDLNSFSIISYEFGREKGKVLANAKERLYLIECCNNGLIYESGAEDEYAWQSIAKSTISMDPDQTYWSYNKRKIYISFMLWSYKRMYYKFDLDKKALFEIAYYDKHVAIGKIGSKLQAIECYDQTFKLDPDHAAAYINNGYSLLDIGCNLEMIECQNNRIELNPKDKIAYRIKAKALVDLGRNLEAIEFYNKAIELNPYDIDLYYVYKGDALCGLGRNLEAIECYSEAIKINNHIKIYEVQYKKGYALHNLGRNIEAIDSFNESIILSPNYAIPYYFKGNTLYDLGRNLEALECYDKAINLDHLWGSLYFGKGNTLYELDRKIEAVECYDTAIKLDSFQASYYFKKAKTLYNLDRKIEAIEWYSKAIELNPDDPLYLCYRACLLSNLNQEIEALQDFNKAYELTKKTQTSENSNNPQSDSFEESIIYKWPSQVFLEFIHILFKLQENTVAFIEELQKLKNILLNNPDLVKEAEESEKIVKTHHSKIIKNAIEFLDRNKNEPMQNQTKQIEKETIEYQNIANDAIAHIWLYAIR